MGTRRVVLSDRQNSSEKLNASPGSRKGRNRGRRTCGKRRKPDYFVINRIKTVPGGPEKEKRETKTKKKREEEKNWRRNARERKEKKLLRRKLVNDDDRWVPQRARGGGERAKEGKVPPSFNELRPRGGLRGRAKHVKALPVFLRKKENTGGRRAGTKYTSIKGAYGERERCQVR